MLISTTCPYKVFGVQSIQGTLWIPGFTIARDFPKYYRKLPDERPLLLMPY